MSSYQNKPPGRGVAEAGAVHAHQEASPPRNRIVRMLLAAVALGTLFIVFKSGETSEDYETVASGPSLMFDQAAGGIMGSSRKQTTVSGLSMKGYPPISIQQEYWEDLQKIDWKEVEKDMKDLLTDSKECEFV